MIAAQQYFIEYNAELNMERLLNLLPNYIPDYCLTNAEKSVDRWATLIVQAYKKVFFLIFLNILTSKINVFFYYGLVLNKIAASHKSC